MSPHLLVKSEKALKDFYDDEFFVMYTTFKMFKELLNLTNCLFTKINDNILHYPCLNLLGKLDLLTPPQYCYDYFKIVKCNDLTFKEYPKGFHDVIHDEEGEDICDDIVEWIKNHINDSTPKFGILISTSKEC